MRTLAHLARRSAGVSDAAASITMPTTMTRAAALAELLAQHETLRAIMDRSAQLADDLDAGRDVQGALAREIVRLRVAFDQHNQFEERLLRPILRDADGFGEVRIDRMVADHVAEHREMRRRFSVATASEFRDAIAHLREHLAGEERVFLTASVVRDDLVVVESGA